MSKLSVSRLVKVDVILSALAAQAQNLSTLLVLTASSVIDAYERIRSYTSLTDVETDFGSTGPEYKAAQLWFSQKPQPSEIKIGRWAKSATRAHIKGKPLSAVQQAIAQFNAVTAPAFSMLIDGIPTTISPASFATATNLNGIATLIQTAISSVAAGATCVWNSVYDRFEISGGSTGAAATFTAPTVPTAYGSINFTANPSANDTITLNGTAITFKAASPVGNQVLIGANTGATLQNLLAFLQASADVQLVKFRYFVVGNFLYAQSVATGTAGNALTLAASAATVSGATLSGGSGTDVSGLLGVSAASSGSYVVQGMTAESALDAAALFDSQFGQTWYGLMMPEATDDDHEAVAGFIEATDTKHAYGITSQDGACLSLLSTSDIMYRIKALGYNKTAVQYSSSSAYAIASWLARILTTDYTANSSTITLMFKDEPGVVAESLTETQMKAIEAKNGNVFVEYNNDTAIIEPGKMASGEFADVIFGADALAVDLQTAHYNLLYTSPTKVPQTDGGLNLQKTTLESVLGRYVDNGFLAPGVWDQQGFGTIKEGDFLPKGYYVFAPPIAKQSKPNRQARKSVTFQIAAKCAGAVQSASIQLNLSR
jgi:hypothetical protein